MALTMGALELTESLEMTANNFMLILANHSSVGRGVKVRMMCVLMINVILLGHALASSGLPKDETFDSCAKAPKIAALFLEGGWKMGYPQALILQNLEGEFRSCLGVDPNLPAHEKPRLGEAFDFVGGTSEGALAALFLTVADETGTRPRYDLSQLVGFYEGDGRDGAGNPTFVSSAAAKLYEDMTECDNDSSWDGDTSSDEESSWDDEAEVALRQQRSEELSHALTELGLSVPLKSACVPTFINATELCQDNTTPKPFQFKSHDMGAFSDLTAAQVAHCALASPMFLDPVCVQDASGNERLFLESGLMQHYGPSIAFLKEAGLLHGDGAQNLLFISVGTRFVPILERGFEPKGIGMLNWAKPIMDLILRPQSPTSDEIIKTLLSDKDPEGLGGYIPWSPALDCARAKDLATPERLAYLRRMTLVFLGKRQDAFKDSARKLARRYQVKMRARAAH
ncbi:MAG: hypothetical protein C0514_06585 [Candidatus Puniceispirillum sp.]|nr:hypothetical protein [Candidatus Puniceispirillum sp.]